MITCANCGIGFSPGYRYCPHCRDFEAPFAQRVDFLTSQAEGQLEAGEPSQDVEDWLIESGFSPLDASDVVASRGRKVRGRTRRHGIRRLIVGLIIMAAGAAGYVAGIYFNRVFFIVAAILVLGLIATLSGLYSMLTGRESPLTVPGELQDLFRSSRR